MWLFFTTEKQFPALNNCWSEWMLAAFCILLKVVDFLGYWFPVLWFRAGLLVIIICDTYFKQGHI